MQDSASKTKHIPQQTHPFCSQVGVRSLWFAQLSGFTGNALGPSQTLQQIVKVKKSPGVKWRCLFSHNKRVSLGRPELYTYITCHESMNGYDTIQCHFGAHAIVFSCVVCCASSCSEPLKMALAHREKKHIHHRFKLLARQTNFLRWKSWSSPSALWLRR